MGELCHGKEIHPVILPVIHIEPKILFETLVSPLRLSISSRVKCSGHVLLDSKYSTEVLCKFSHEVRIPVANDLSRESEAFEDMC